MLRSSKTNTFVGRRYALCVGIGTYTKLDNSMLRYASADAKEIAERLGDPRRGNFTTTLLAEPHQTTKNELDVRLYNVLNAPELEAEDLVVIYLSCHGRIYGKSNTFYLLPRAFRNSETLPCMS